MNTSNFAGINIDNIPVPEVPVPEQYRPWLKFIYPVIAVVIALAAFTLLILPTLNDTLLLKSESDENATKASNLDQNVQTLKSANVDKLKDDLDKLEGALPSDKDAAGFLTNVTQDANSAGVSISGVQLVPATPTTGAAAGAGNVLEFQMVVSGPYPSIRGFLTKIETTRRVMEVNNILLNSQDSKLSASLTIDTYYEPAPKIVAGSTDPLPQWSASNKVFGDIDSRTVVSPPIATPNAAGRTDPFSGF